MKGTPQHQSPSHEIRTPYFALLCLARPGFRYPQVTDGLPLRLFDRAHSSHVPSVRGPLGHSGYVHPCCLNCARPNSDQSHRRFAGPDAACDATGVYVREVLMLRIPARSRASSAHRKAYASLVGRTSRVARCPFLSTSVQTATVLVRTSQKSQPIRKGELPDEHNQNTESQERRCLHSPIPRIRERREAWDVSRVLGETNLFMEKQQLALGFTVLSGPVDDPEGIVENTGGCGRNRRLELTV